jgi:acetolactate synthase-1/2/3 large subunit
MHPSHPVQSQPATAAEAYLGLLAARGVEYLFANGGTDFAPVVEAYARGKSLGWRMPEPVIVPHENMGVAMAHGFTMVTGRAQAMMVHVGMGTANAVNGLINAARMNIPMLFSAGRTPLTESGAVPGARNNYIHWAQEHFDQGAMLREFMKWDYELRHAEQVETAVDRALAIARSEPQGPVYLTLPREILAAPFAVRTSAAATQVAASAPAADPEALEEAARWLARAERPLLITANAGRTAEAAKAIAHLSETFGIPVVHYRPRYFALSTEHPMHAGWEPHALLKDADLVLVVECDVPWIPRQGSPSASAKVVHIGPDPLYARYPLRGFRTDLALAGLTAPTVAQLAERALAHAPAAARLRARFEAGAQRFAAARAKQRGAPAAMSAKYASACVSRLLDADTIVVNEYPLVLEEIQVRSPCRYYASAPAGGLGWGLGAALGAKLAAPDKSVVCCVGDGAYMFGNPTASHFVSEAMKLPVLFVVFNNARWAAVHRSTLAMYPKGVAAGMAEPPFATLEPSPRFEKTIEASGGYGVRVERVEDLMPALERALTVVKTERRQALVNLRLEAGYVKTS